MRPIIGSIAKKAGYVFAALVIVAAILVVISRLMTPYVDARRGELEAMAGEILGTPITIEKASVSWFQYQPGVALHNVTILDKGSKDPVLQIRTVNTFISIPQSIWQRKLVISGLMVSGAELVVRQSSSGEFVVQGFPALGGYNNEPFKNESKIIDVFAWLSMQPLLILRDIDVRYTGVTGTKHFVTLYNLRLENSATQHLVLGKAILHQDISTELSLAGRWEGVVSDPQNINGKVYVNLSGMSLAQWAQGLVWNAWEIRKGLVSAKVWATWRAGGFQQVQGSFQLFNVDLYSGTDKSIRRINRLSGDVGWKKQGNDQVIAGDDILIDWSSRLWPVTSFYVKLSPDSKQRFAPVIMNFGYFDLADIRAILASSPKFLPDAIIKTVNDLNLSGNLENISISFPGDAGNLMPVMVQGQFNHLSFQSAHGMPDVANLSGAFVWKEMEGSLSLHSRQTVIKYPSIFDHEILLEQLTGDVIWLRSENGEWKFTFKSIGALNSDVAVNMSGQLILPSSLKPTVDLAANFTLHNIAHLKNYLPAKVLSKELAEWLGSAFLAGNAPSGSILLRGALADFPFDHDDGRFTATTAVSNVQLHYAPDWPDLKNIAAKVQFIGRNIIIDVDKTQMMGIDIGKVHGEIPDLGTDKPVVLSINGTPIKTDFTAGMNFLHQSPLEKTIGRMLRDVELTGPIELTLALTIPLEHADDTEVKGVIKIDNSTMRLTPWNLSINRLAGNVNFTEKIIDAPALQGELFDKPLRLDLSTKSKSATQSIVQATVTNVMDLNDIESWLKIPFAKVAKGSTNVTTIVDLAVDQPVEIHIETNLTGIALDLPKQYAKIPDEIRNFTADITVSEKQPLKLKLNYADLLNAALILDRAQDSFNLQSVNLRLGKGVAEWPQGKGLYITGTLHELNADKIKSYLNMSGDKNTTGLQLKLIDVVIDAVNYSGITLTKARVQLSPSANYWVVTITSPEVAGKIEVPINFVSAATLTANLQRINLDALTSGKSGGLAIEAKSLPTIKFTANSITYGKSSLGNVSFNTSPSANGLVIQSFAVRSSNMNMQASGDWIQSAKGDATRLHGKASSMNVSAFLNDLGFNVHNFVSSNGNLDFDLNWSSSPLSLSLDTMNGQASLDMGKGRIVEVSQASDAKMDFGRMLNLFSLQSIPRRLSLDFSDVFMKGYSFDTLKADFKFTRGDASTSNMRFDGTLARVEIRGKIGLARKDFDLILSVTPYVTSSIPVAATLITGQPVIGLAAWAVNKMISGEVSKVATYYYSVTGSWVDPVWNTIKSGSSNTSKT